MSDVGNMVQHAGKLYECVPITRDESCASCAFSMEGELHNSGMCHRSPCDGGYYTLVKDSTASPPKDPANPKDLIGSKKLPVGLVPDTVSILAAQAFAEGASKYGAYNWRAAGVRLSIYMEAMRRHQMKLWNGEWADKKTKVPHLASIIACAGIIADAKAIGKLVDDRPPVLDMEPLIEEAEAVIQHVQALNAHMKPHHHTIADTAC